MPVAFLWWAGSHKVADKGQIFTKTIQMVSIGAIFTSTFHTKQLNPWPNSPVSQVKWWVTAGYLLAKGLWSHLKVTQALVDVWQASETSHSKSSPSNFQHQHLSELLVNVYSYHSMVKSVSCCCVRGSWFFSNPVTIGDIISVVQCVK